MNFVSIIETKRDGLPLSAEQIEAIVHEAVAGRLPDYQLAAFLMAVFFRGMSPQETKQLTLAMRDSGEVLRFPPDTRPVVDKHSTGGVGDKVSLPLAPLLACLGFRVPMISGRGLGITGGTLDKLESIPGFSTQLEPSRIVRQVQEIGVAMAGQTRTMVPADKKLYALRDVTGTVPSIPLITASILSKKLAEGLEALVMDVKFGRAAFMQTMAQARELAQAIVSLAECCGVKARALLTDMDAPLGRAAGNWLEVCEAVECLENGGPDDLRALVVEMAAHLLEQNRMTPDLTEGRARACACLRSGAPRQKWNEMLQAQGADLAAFEAKLRAGPAAPAVLALTADQAGFVTGCDAQAVGQIVRDLGGGRLTQETRLDPTVGVDQLAKVGEPVERGRMLGRLHARTSEEAHTARARLQAAFAIGPRLLPHSPLIAEVVVAVEHPFLEPA